MFTHHERWDGSGYPRGLGGVEIPLAGRLVAVVDTYDAAGGPAPYKAAMSHDEALAIIAKGRGASFDPAIVDAFIAVSSVAGAARATKPGMPGRRAAWRLGRRGVA